MNPAPIGWGEYARLMLVLCGILALAVVAIRFWLPKLSLRNQRAGGPIEIFARLPLEPRRTLYIVKAANSYILLATSEAGVQNLAALSADECSAWRQKNELSPSAKL
jgi:flagellar protein FliO/FliZ